MMGELPSQILIVVCWFQDASRDCPNPAEFKVKLIVVFTRALQYDFLCLFFRKEKEHFNFTIMRK